MTIRQFAERIGFSYVTVSRAINDHPLVSSETKERIFQAMDEYGFRPNPLARGLRGGGSGLIGVCFVDLHLPILESKLYWLQKFLRAERLRGLVEISERSPESETRIIRDFLQIGVQGVILVNSTLGPEESRRLCKGVAAVHADPMIVQDMPSVVPDRYAATQRLLQILYDLGHRRFALLGFDESNESRWPPISDLARQLDLDLKRDFVIIPKTGTAQSISAGREMALRLLASGPPPTAVIALNDEVALGAILTFLEQGWRVPEDISVTGFDNLEIARELHPTITTVEQYPEMLMRYTVELLIQEIGAEPTARGAKPVRRVDLQVIEGESTANASARASAASVRS